MPKDLSEAVAVPEEAPKTVSRISPRQLLVGAIAILALAAGLVYGISRLRFNAAHEETDDAQVEGHISPVLPRVSGYVARVLVNDNESVKAGQTLVEIDPDELDLKVAEAEAALKGAVADRAIREASLASARAAAATAAANVETAMVLQKKAAHDLERDTRLFRTGAITDSQLTDTQAQADTTAAQLDSARSTAETAKLQISVADARVAAARTVVAEKASDLDFGKLANFKETQLTHMESGQDVEFEADSYPGVTFHGRVESISGATGARFALLPPDNSTGNFVKVTQRVPVKIVLTEAPSPDHPLRPGMSVDAVVRVRD